MDTLLHIHPIPAFKDNYIWIIHNNQYAVVVDPGDADVVLQYLASHQLKLVAILITHHHHDHIGGIAELVKNNKTPVYGPVLEQIPHLTHAVQEGDLVHIHTFNIDFKILDIPGHTSGHIAYYGLNSVFCGDTLFGCGCGRLFEGTPAQMYASLSKLAQLPADTAVYCAHEYTLSGIHFALTLEPDNTALQQRLLHDQALRLQNLPTLPSTIAVENATNPFLRCHLPSLQSKMGIPVNLTNALLTFTAVRTLKDNS
jgi:hydroxyacylglutathione hydrolase